jgi:hypothetical protein
MISFGGAVLSRGSRGLCSLAHVSDTLGMKHLFAQFGIDCHVHMSGFRTDSSSYHKVIAKHT